MPKKLILASASPRRRRLLKQIGLTFEVIPGNVDEDDIISHDPLENIQHIALRKANDVAAGLEDGIVLGADTQIFIDDRILGKPKDEAEAMSMLAELSGRTHRAVTGVALVDAAGNFEEKWVEVTLVTFRELSEDEIREYVDTGEPMGKAGAYGIQGRAAAFVERLEGCYFNIVGLPLAKLSQKLRKLLV